MSSSDKIDEFEKSLTRYKSAIESGVNLYTAFASVRILDSIDEICAWLPVVLILGYLTCFESVAPATGTEST